MSEKINIAEKARELIGWVLDDIEVRREAIQKSCPHTKTTFRGDASLGDSYRECECCGAQL